MTNSKLVSKWINLYIAQRQPVLRLLELFIVMNLQIGDDRSQMREQVATKFGTCKLCSHGRMHAELVDFHQN